MRRGWLASSQVSDWFGSSSIEVPSQGKPLTLVGSPVVASVGGSSSNTATTAAYPTPAVGDLIVVVAYQRSGLTGAVLSVASSGLTFNQIAYSGDGTTGIGAWYAVSPDATARTVSASYTGTPSAVSGIGVHVYVLRNAFTPAPVDGAANFAVQASASSYTVSGITVNRPNSMLIVGVGTSDDNSASLSGGGLSTTGGNIGTQAGLVSGRGLQAAGSTGNITATLSVNGPDGGHSIIFAIRPA